MTKPSLSVELCGTKMKSPLVLASGIWGLSAGSMKRAYNEGCGAVTSKSCSMKPRKGHRNPTVVFYDNIMLNAVGFTNPGVDLMKEELREVVRAKVPLLASVFAGSIEEFAQIAQLIEEVKPQMIEIDISCPNVDSEFGMPYACSPETAAKVTEAVKNAIRTPLSVKLTPGVSDIASIAKAVEAAGADAICAINTIKGMAIDLEARRPVLTNKVGGVSGPALFPIALRCVYEVARAVEIPIIGTGGVTTGRDALQMIMAGARTVGVGSAVGFRHEAFRHINEEMVGWMKENGYRKLSELKLEE